MRRISRRRLAPSLAALAAALLATGCPLGDPGLGVSGDLALGETADASGYVTLEIRAFADPEESWDPSLGLPEVEWRFSESRPLTPSDTFPTSYRFMNLGTVPTRYWRVVAWISQDASSVAPGPGDWWGTARFRFDGCGSYGGFCDDIGGVDLTLDAQLPIAVP